MAPKDSSSPSAAMVRTPEIPPYLSETYTWAYLSRPGCVVFDHQAVVSTILWGNARRLIRSVVQELQDRTSVV